MIQLTGAGKRSVLKPSSKISIGWSRPTSASGIVGANGTGKSTLLKILAGIDGLDGGSMTVQKAVTRATCRRKGFPFPAARYLPSA